MAKSKFDEAQDIAKLVTERIRDHAYRIAENAAQATGSWHAELADAIRTELKLIGYSTKQVERAINKHVKRLQLDDKRVQAIADGIIESARAARTLPQEVFDAVYAKEAAVDGVAPFAPESDQTLRLLPPPAPASEDEPPSTD